MTALAVDYSPVVSKAHHEAMLLELGVRVPASVSTLLRVFYAKCDWASGLCSWALSGRRLVYLTRMIDRTVQRALAWLLGRHWLRVQRVAADRAHVYALDTPRAWQIRQAIAGRDASPSAPPVEHAPPARSWMGRFADRVREVVTGAPTTLPAPPAVVPFMGGHAPDPTLMPRPRFDVPGTDATPADVEPIESWQARDARRVGPTYASREDAAAAARAPGLDVAPTGPLPPRDQPHRRIAALWSRAEHERHGWHLALVGEDHDAIRWLLATLGLDATERLILRVHRERPRGVPRYLPGLRWWVARRTPEELARMGHR